MRRIIAMSDEWININYRCRCHWTLYIPRRSHPLAVRSTRQRADGHTLTLYCCKCFYAKGKVGPENVTISKLPGALPPPH